jgi:predicted DNA-binding protein (UPF0251 family)
VAQHLDTVQDVARAVLTTKQYDAWRLEAAGISQRHIALVLGIGRSAVRDRLYEAHTRIARAVDMEGV